MRGNRYLTIVTGGLLAVFLLSMAGRFSGQVIHAAPGERATGKTMEQDTEDAAERDTGEEDTNPVSGNSLSALELLRPAGGGSRDADAVSGNAVSGNAVSGNAVSGNAVSGNNVSGNAISGNAVPGNNVSGNSVSGNKASEKSVSDNDVSGNSVSENDISGNSISGNGISDNSISGNNLFDGSVSGDDILIPGSGKRTLTLGQRQKLRSSHQETLLAKEWDRSTISENTIDFSGVKIACLGDSITEAVNLDSLENYKELAYPAILGEALGAESVVNLGKGGSSIGRYWADAFVDRYQEIPEDTDLILVMGGTNDGFCASLVEFGTLGERKKRTFVGDLDELMDGLVRDYPDAEVIFFTPLPNNLQDHLKKDHPYLIPQENYAQVIIQLAQEHGMTVIDLYHSNILDAHDKDIVLHFMPDGVHPNEEGYRILGNHVAADLIRLLTERSREREDSSR